MAGENTGELDKYIDGLSDIAPESNVTDTTVNDGDDDAGDANEQSASPLAVDNKAVDGLTQDKNTVDDKSGQKTSKEGGKQPLKGKEAATPDNLRPIGDGTFTNAKGDIVDAKGAIIATNGFAARMYSTNKRLKTQLEEQNAQLSQVQAAVGEVRALATSIRNYNLDNTEVAQALDLAGRMKKGDHLGVAKEVLAIIAAQGYNITDLLGSEVGDSIELKAINKMIDERLAPITRQEQDRQRTVQAEQAGRRQYDRFVADNPHADVHADDIVEVMKREGCQPQQAYNRLAQFAYANRLDFSKPLKPQIQAYLASRAQQGQQQQRPNTQPQGQRPLPNGAGSRTNGAMPSTALSNADDDWGSIIKQVQQTLNS